MNSSRTFALPDEGSIDEHAESRPLHANLESAAVLLPLYGVFRQPLVFLLLGSFVAFFGTGYFSGFGPLTAETYPTTVRASAQGFTYNIGRVASAIAPLVVGSMAQARGFGFAFTVTGATFLVAAIAWLGFPSPRPWRCHRDQHGLALRPGYPAAALAAAPSEFRVPGECQRHCDRIRSGHRSGGPQGLLKTRSTTTGRRRLKTTARCSW